MSLKYVARYKLQPIISTDLHDEKTKYHEFWLKLEGDIELGVHPNKSDEIFCGTTHWSIENIILITEPDSFVGFIEIHKPQCGLYVDENENDEIVRKHLLREFKHFWKDNGFQLEDYYLGNDISENYVNEFLNGLVND